MRWMCLLIVCCLGCAMTLRAAERDWLTDGRVQWKSSGPLVMPEERADDSVSSKCNLLNNDESDTAPPPTISTFLVQRYIISKPLPIL